MRNNLWCIVFFVFLFSCADEKKSKLHSLKFSSQTNQLLNDTTSFGSIIDSFRVELKNASCDTVAIDWLNKLAFAWKGKPIKLFADEALRQSEKVNYKNGKATAIGHQGYALYWNYQEDSALIYYNNALELANDKKVKAQLISYVGDVYRVRLQHEDAMQMYRESMKLATAANDKERLAMLHSVIADIYRLQNSFDSSLFHYQLSAELSKKTHDINRLAFCYSYIGDVSRLTENYVKALENFNIALNLAQKSEDKNRLAFIYMSKGEVYKALMEPDSAMNNFNKALELSRSIQDHLTALSTLYSIGMMNENFGKLDQAIKYYRELLVLSRNLQEKIAEINALISLGEYHRKIKKDLDSCDFFHEQAFELSKTSKFNFGMCRLLLIKSYRAFDEKKHGQSIVLAQRTLDSALKYHHIDIVKEGYRMMVVNHEMQGDFKSAFQYNRVYQHLKDSLMNHEEIKKFATAEYKNTERNLVSLHQQKEKIHKAEKAQKDEEIKRQRFMRNTFIFGFGIIALFSVLLFRSLRANKKAKKIIEHQKELVEEKQKEIIDSIKYAQRIQKALLPPDKYLERFFKRKH